MRQYNVIAVVECPKMANHGQRIQMNAKPMPHEEACTFKSKLTDYSWRRVMLVEVIL